MADKLAEREQKPRSKKKRCGKARVYDRGQLEEAKTEAKRKKQEREENQKRVAQKEGKRRKKSTKCCEEGSKSA